MDKDFHISYDRFFNWAIKNNWRLITSSVREGYRLEDWLSTTGQNIGVRVEEDVVKYACNDIRTFAQ
jgi:hypothetical protein